MKEKEVVYYVVDSLGVSHPETMTQSVMTLPDYFVSGGVGMMTIISLFLIALLIAAWKAPRWVKEIGIGALVVSILATLSGLHQMFTALQMIGDVSPAVICGGLKAETNHCAMFRK